MAVSRLNRDIAERLATEIRVHNPNMGGITFALVGSKGSGKTHSLIRMAHQMTYLSQSGIPKRETVIWRGRNLDYWNWMYDPSFQWTSKAFRRKTYIHHHEQDVPEFTDEFGFPLSLPPDAVKTYRSPRDLHRSLVPGEINVVYEPTHYDMTVGMEELIISRACSAANLLDDLEIDPALWWAEFLFYLLNFKKAGFVTVILDEADEIFPQSVSGIRWHIQSLFCDSAKDFRKANISLIYSIHDITDLDYRLRSKTQYWGYMRGARPKPGSLIYPKALINLPTGEIYLERDGFGNINFGKFLERPRVRAAFLTGIGDPTLWDIYMPKTTNSSGQEAIPPLTCPYCGHSWQPRTTAPRQCPRCKNNLSYAPADSSGL